ncbi:MAG: leucine-rich repeat protein [Clostridia bacterium]|nr:leucine-rich repeat protein [Clostridia bacterium]
MKKRVAKTAKSTLTLFLVALLALSPLTVAYAEKEPYTASSIQQLQDVLVNYQQYLNNEVMFQLPDTVKDDQEISVIVTVDVATLMDAYEDSAKTMSFTEFALESDEAEAIRTAIAEEKASLLATLDEQKVPYKLGEEYATVLSGFELQITARDFRVTCQSLGKGQDIIVGEEYKVAATELVENPVDVFDTGIFDSSDAPYDGSGTVVAVLDTGLDSKHTAFSVDNFTSTTLGLTYEQVAAVLGDTKASEQTEGLTVDDVYINNKVPFGYDYADSDPDPYSTHNNHGTHVSGVIVGKDDTITGVAPNAQLVSMKVFSDVMDTARAAWILAALEDCVVLGVDVINMSLGTACGFSREGDEEKLSGVYDRIREAGISMVVAASNSYSSAYGSEKNGNLPLTSNPDSGTVGSPGTYEGVMSVASINGAETPYIKYNNQILYFIETTNGAAEENNFCDTLLGEEDSVKLEYVIIPGVGRSADYTGMDVKGKIALVRRGSNTFEEKAMIAEAQGAAGIIIYNNVSGDIKMNVGDAKLAACSISQDDGEMLVAQGNGTITVSRSQSSGPFISDFSSWGPTPSLGIKPEITAHGGQILSSITGGGYDRLSGTSMACPNLAGVVLLLRQYVVENFPEIAEDNVAVNKMVNRLMMSTADIALGKNALPYFVRKQGAGLANLNNALNTDAIIITYDKDGKEMDKTKLELGDDKEKTGAYEMKFAVKNFGDKTLTYELGAHILTEGVSDTKTSHGETTVTEESYALNGDLTVGEVTGGTVKGKKLTVKAGETATVTVTVTLSDEDKAYLDKSFENGMYVEGFITLAAKKGTDISMSIPYLAYYGDWTVAPLMDLDYFETDADDMDDSIAIEDKVMPDAYATRPIGGVEDDYVSYLGSYYFLQDPKDLPISATREHASLSNQVGTIHSLRFIWTGLLRNAAKVVVTITDDVTGEVVYECEDLDVRKSYGDGGATIYPANVELEFDTTELNLKNNTKYTVNMTGYMDYGDGGLTTNKNNTFSFPLTIDFEAPTITDVEYYYEYDKTQKKNRLYAKVGVYDNHYAMSTQLGYVTMGKDENDNPISELKSFEQYLTPVYSKENSTTYITYELTDYIYTIKEGAINRNSFVVTCYDYAMNYASYEIGLPDNFVDFYLDGLDEGLTLSPNEVFTLEPLVYPVTEWGELLEFTSSRPSVVNVVNNKLVAVNPGSATIKVRDPDTNKTITFPVTVLGKDDKGYKRYDKPVADQFGLNGYYVNKAYYVVANEDKDIGDTGETRFFEGNYSLALYPSETVTLNYTLASYFPADTTVKFESSNESIVTVNAAGAITAVAEGFASITMKVLQNDRSTYYSETVSIEVKDPYLTTGASLTHYYGNGGEVVIPEDLSLTTIGNFAFSNFEYVLKTEEELAFDDAETSKAWFIGDSTITRVVIPEGVETISAYAFANLTALEEVVFPSTLEHIDYGAFYNCTALEKITFSGENNLKIINQNAFENCALSGKLDLSSACVISDYAFAGNASLKEVTTSDSLLSIGQYAFAGCKKLKTVTITAPKVKYGAYAFTDCEALTAFYVNASVLPEGMFYECKKLKEVTIGPDVNDIGEFAFRDAAVEKFIVDGANKTYKVQTAGYILSADSKTLIAINPTLRGEVTAATIGGAAVTAIAKGAFSHNDRITGVNLPTVTTVGEYAFGSCENLESVTLGTLTQIGEYAFFETAIKQMPAIAANAKIGRYAFSHSKLTTVTIPDGFTVAEGVFSECLHLTSVTIGNNVKLEKFAFNISKNYAFTVQNYLDKGAKRFYYEFASTLEELTIGKDADIGENAFANTASLKKINLGAGAKIGKMAFYNTTCLESIDLSAAVSIGDYAFSGDVYYVYMDEGMSVPLVNNQGMYVYTYHGPALKSINIGTAKEIGEHAFSYCRQLTDVTLNDSITVIPPYAFAGCVSLKNINLSKIKTVDEYAFIESALTAIDLSSVEEVGDYAFVDSDTISHVKFGKATEDKKGNKKAVIKLGEGAFTYCPALATVENMANVKEVGDYAFAYTALKEADLSGAESIGTHAFLKEAYSPLKVTLGSTLKTLGDNPFALCVLEPFHLTETTSFNGVDHVTNIYDYEISDAVKVIDGSLYCAIDTGLELITFIDNGKKDVKVADNTVRITAMAFTGSKLQRVTLPYTVGAVGHKAFFDCKDMELVAFNSYYPPVLEEEFDPTYYESLEHIPGSGDFGTYTDYDGNEVVIKPMGLIPYFMWNATGGMYSNVFYGANFIDYVGYVDKKMTMVKPINGQCYDSYIMGQYFDRSLEGPAAPDATTVAAIKAIDAIPDKVSYADKALVEAARAAYNKIATTEQQALVTNYADLISAEQRIMALDPNNQTEEPEPVPMPGPTLSPVLIVLLIVAGVLVVLIAAVLVLKKTGWWKKIPLINKIPFAAIGAAVGGFCRKVFTPVGNVLKKVFSPVGRFLKKIFAPVGRVLMKVLAPIGRFFAKIGLALWAGCKKLGGWVKGLFTKKEKAPKAPKEKKVKQPKEKKVKEPKEKKVKAPKEKKRRGRKAKAAAEEDAVTADTAAESPADTEPAPAEAPETAPVTEEAEATVAVAPEATE